MLDAAEDQGVVSDEPDTPLSEAGSLITPRAPKRNATSVVPRLMDNKRQNLERKMSAAERDNMLFRESKEEALFHRDLTQAIRESNESVSRAMDQMANYCSHSSFLQHNGPTTTSAI